MTQEKEYDVDHDIKERKENFRCQKCGGETRIKLIRDESYDECVDCGILEN